MDYLINLFKGAQLVLIIVLLGLLFTAMIIIHTKTNKIIALSASIQVQNFAIDKVKSDAKAEYEMRLEAQKEKDSKKFNDYKKIVEQPKLRDDLTCEQIRLYLIANNPERKQ